MFNKILIFLLGAALFAIQVENVSAKLPKLHHIQPHLKIKPAKINPLDLIDDGHKLFDEVEQQASWSYNISLGIIEAGLVGFNVSANTTFYSAQYSVERQSDVLLSHMEQILSDNQKAGIDISSCYDPSHQKMINYLNETMDSMVDCMSRRIENTVEDLLSAEEDIRRIYGLVNNFRRAFDRCRDDDCRQNILDEVNEMKSLMPLLMEEIAGLSALNLIHDVNLLEICFSRGVMQVANGNDIVDELTACIDDLPTPPPPTDLP